MSLEIDKLYYTVTLDIKELQKDIDGVKKKIAGMSGSVESEGSKMGAIFKKLGALIATAFAAVGLTAFIKKIAVTRGEFEQLGVAFETMLKSKEKADKLMEQVVALAAKTPFTLKEVAGAAKSLLAYGYAAEEVVPNIGRLGDIASGLNISMSDMTYLFGTARTQGRLFSRDMIQMAGRGIPVYTELAKVLNTDAAGVVKLVEAGKVGFPELQKMVVNLTSEGGMFYNLMEKQSKTLTGLLSNLGDAWDRLLNSLGEGRLGTIMKNIISGTTTMFNNFREAFGSKASERLEEERFKLNNLVGAITSVNTATKTRASLIAQLRSDYPGFLKGIKDENVTNAILLKTLKEVNEEYLKKIAIEANKEDIAKNTSPL